ncbi:hypothetical protein E2C01_018501 [Portunus trituberculatus]|uniref:Uncharacterized protein n=1 Tax=Portunus trituberculatus TaxID=210409 RepID=A0A5B7DUL7_PORTR|nr:hypothetical protein [Portunus trituberculatus]
MYVELLGKVKNCWSFLAADDHHPVTMCSSPTPDPQLPSPTHVSPPLLVHSPPSISQPYVWRERSETEEVHGGLLAVVPHLTSLEPFAGA